jgi:tetratricopeptide (TPR) repeat protein
MTDTTTGTPFEEGIKALNAGKTEEALGLFEQAAEKEETPLVSSYLAYCRAKETGVYLHAVSLCMEAIKEDPKQADVYLNLGRIYLMAGQKRAAIRAFDLGLRCGKHTNIVKELEGIGRRKRPPLPFLSRSNPCNKFLGKFLKMLGMR